MTALRTTNSPIRLPRALRAALLGLSIFSAANLAAAGSAATAPQAQTLDGANSTATTQPATATATPQQQPTEAASTTLPSGKTVALGASRWDYKNAEFFKRISEYFTGAESTGYRIILRTDPQQRDGLYFQSPLSVTLRDLPEGSAFQVRFISPYKSDATVSHTFAIPADLRDSGKSQLWLGFTGADTPANEAPPVAWQIRVIDAEGKQLAATNSFLWSQRDGR